MSDIDLVAEFLKNGGTVTKVTEGARAIGSDKTIYKAMREGGKAKADAIVSAERAEIRAFNQQQLSEIAMEAAVEANHLGHKVVGIEDNVVIVQSDMDDFYIYGNEDTYKGLK